MATPISALDHNNVEFIREVSPEAIAFYVDELSGIYLPEDFQATNAERLDVKYWKPEDRLQGKFGRFTVTQSGEVDGEPLQNILVMGTTIGLRGLNRYGDMHTLFHRELLSGVNEILYARGLYRKVGLEVEAVDYGSTRIKIDEKGAATSIVVDGASMDFGRADEEGRNETFELFQGLLGSEIEVVNGEPAPREFQRIIKRSTP